MNIIEISFPRIKCKKCDSSLQYAILKSGRYGIYCRDCGAYIKWADSSQTTIIKARLAWLKEHEKEVIN